jgi:hypothetical protein
MSFIDNFKKNSISGTFLIVGNHSPNPNHKFLEFGVAKPKMTTFVALNLIKQYLPNEKKNLTQWKKENGNWTINNPELNKVSHPISYLIIAKEIRESGYFDYQKYNLSWLHQCWLDHSNNHTLGSHIITNEKKSTITFYDGDFEKNFHNKFPLKPTLCREGILVANFFEPLLDRIIKQRIELVETSNQIFTLEWLFKLKNLINDTISSIDILLNAVYIKAQYDPLPNWTFDEIKMGRRHSIKLKEKFKWVFKLTGNYLDISQESNSLNYLKGIRNHLNHFDPPCFAVTLEEIASWLNMIIDIGMIILKVRQKLYINGSNLIYNFLLQPLVQFKAESIFENRGRLDNNIEGYETSIWTE